MARLQYIVSAPGSQGGAAFETALNAILTPLTSHTFLGWQAEVTDKLPAYTRDFRGVIDVQTGGTAIGTPYQAKMFEGASPEEAIALTQAFMAANTTYFFAAVIFLYSDQLPNIAKRYVFALIYNTVLANGAANWAVGGNPGGSAVPSGPAGGDLAGSYPNPTLAAIVAAAGPIGDASTVPVITIDAKGRVTALSSTAISLPATPQTVVTAAMSPYTVQAADLYILLDTSAGPIQINLPTAATARLLRLKGITGTMQANPVTLVPTGVEKIENLAASKIVTTNFGSFDLLASPSQSSWFTL